MSKWTLETKVGLFFIVCVAIFAYSWFALLGFKYQKGFDLEARFRSVEGLVQGAQVQIAGLKVGSVKGIRFDREAGKAVVTMEIRDDYKGSITEGAKVTLRTKGLLGEKYVVIEPDKPNARKLKSGDEISLVYEPMDPNEIIENIGIASHDLQLLTAEARKQLIDEDGARKLANTVDNSNKLFRDMSDIVSKNKEKINRTIDQAERASAGMDKSGEKFSKLASDLESLTRDVRAGRGTLGRLVTDETLYREANSLVRDFRQLSNRIQSGPGAVSRLINDPELYYEARRAIRNMNKTAEDVSEATPVSTLAIILGSILR